MDTIQQVFGKLAVLVVDDMEAIRTTVTWCLQDLGIKQFHSAQNGSVAWQLLQNTKIDIIICDWDMPKVSGIELLKLVRDSKDHQHIPFLMLTSMNDRQCVLDAIEQGADDYLSKPFQPKELEARIIKSLRKLKQQ